MVSQSARLDDGADSGAGVSPFVLAGLVGIALFSLYVLLYALNIAALDRYAAGFVLHSCPVCTEGKLEIEERPYRALGLPRVRRTARCDTCRSVLREVGRRRWRYSVDPHANPELFADYNNRVVSEASLLKLGSTATKNDNQPIYLDDDQDLLSDGG